METDFETLIVGGGLAGCVLASELQARGQSVAIIDEPHLSSCSRQAMGVVNPLVLRSLRLQEQIQEAGEELDFFDLARHRYGAFYRERPIAHVFSDPDERQKWEKRVRDGTNPWLGQLDEGPLPAPWDHSHFTAPWGWAEVKGTALVDVNAFINHQQQQLLAQGRYFIHSINDHELSYTPDAVQCGSWSARRLVFCEGWRIMLNTRWQKVGLKASKGETLTVELGIPGHPAVESEDMPILHREIHLVALPDSQSFRLRLGSSHSWDDFSEVRTEKARAELLFKLSQLYDGPVRVLEQRCGIRPAARDRRPILGFHPETDRLAVLNGLGMRGILLAPGLAWLLANALEGEDCIPPIWNVGRFWLDR